MLTTLPILTAAFFCIGDSPRQPHPFAPSLPQLSNEEEAALDEVVNRFILFDTGKLTGDAGKKAKQDFEKLGPDATFALIRGLNQAAKIEHSCPALVIARKLARLLNASEDAELLAFARENIGIGVKQTRHQSILNDLRLTCMLRKNQVGKKLGSVASAPKPPVKMTIAELAEVATTQTGTRQKLSLMELSYRPGDDALTALAQAASTASEAGSRQFARDYLERSLSRQTEAVILDKLKSIHAELRAASAKAAGSKGLRIGTEFIDLLDDEYDNVRSAARQALVRLASGKVDFGPETKASESERAESIKKWREWWAKQSP